MGKTNAPYREKRKTHIPHQTKKNKHACGINQHYSHLIYIPKKGDTITKLIKRGVCWRCIFFSGMEGKLRWK